MINKQKLPLYIALAIPVVMVLLVAGFIYLPGAGQRPKYNFVYMSGNNIYYSYGRQEYEVSGGHLIQNPAPTPTPVPPVYPVADNTQVHFYLYNVSDSSAQEISFQQAAAYNLDSTNMSPDDYTIEQGNGGGGDFIFGSPGGDYSSWFIKGHNRSTKLNLKLNGSGSYPGNFEFLGWVE